MSSRSLVLHILSTCFNAAIGFFAFWFMVFATSPETQDATMRAGYYVLWGIVGVATVGVVAPWVLTLSGRPRAAGVGALLPTVLAGLALLSFLLLDSWIRRTF